MRKIFYLFLLISGFNSGFSQRSITLFNDDWQFLKSDTISENTPWKNITIPHTWNLDAYDNSDFVSEKLTWVSKKAYEKGSWGYIGGEIFRKSPRRIGTTADIKNTVDTPLLQTKRENIKEFVFDVPNGMYEVELSLADLHTATTKMVYDLSRNQSIDNIQSIFDVVINGKKVLKNFSPAQLKGNNIAITEKFVIENKFKKITVAFETVEGSTFLNAIKLKRR